MAEGYEQRRKGQGKGRPLVAGTNAGLYWEGTRPDSVFCNIYKVTFFFQRENERESFIISEVFRITRRMFTSYLRDVFTV